MGLLIINLNKLIFMKNGPKKYKKFKNYIIKCKYLLK